jgi:hypothetical protein
MSKENVEVVPVRHSGEIASAQNEIAARSVPEQARGKVAMGGGTWHVRKG